MMTYLDLFTCAAWGACVIAADADDDDASDAHRMKLYIYYTEVFFASHFIHLH